MPYLPTDRAKLQKQLEAIVGEPFSAFYRAAGQICEFGEQKAAKNKRGEDITQADLTLKFITSDWRIIQAGRIVVGSSDFSDGKWFYDSNPIEHDKDAASAERISAFLELVSQSAFSVVSVEVDSLGDITIRLSEGLLIQSFASTSQDDDLWWFYNRTLDLSALVGPENTHYTADAV